MKVSDFDFDLPESLIANYPAEERTASRLLKLDRQTGGYEDARFVDLKACIQPGDLLVFNNTKVVPARLFAQKETGGKLEILFERRLSESKFAAHVRSSKSPKPGSGIVLEDGSRLTMTDRDGSLFILETDGEEVFELLARLGHIPLPPYIKREDGELDQDRYQTVYAQHEGSAAAPTAGLHFDQAFIESLREAGVETAEVTLHVGAGTFQPVKVDTIEDHVMHREWIDVPQEVVDKIKATKEKGGRVIAIGTTSCRSLEAAASSGELTAFRGDTEIFIYPGYRFKVVDALFTNFHLPQSTLLMLVSALASRESVIAAYEHAVKSQYRFFSYGDAMFIANNLVSIEG